PVLATTSGYVACLNVAVSEASASIVTEHGFALPVQAPCQPVKVEPTCGTARISTTMGPMVVSTAKGAEHAVPQLIPAGVDTSVPSPVPAFPTLRSNVVRRKVAVMATSPLGFSEHA